MSLVKWSYEDVLVSSGYYECHIVSILQIFIFHLYAFHDSSVLVLTVFFFMSWLIGMSFIF